MVTDSCTLSVLRQLMYTKCSAPVNVHYLLYGCFIFLGFNRTYRDSSYFCLIYLTFIIILSTSIGQHIQYHFNGRNSNYKNHVLYPCTVIAHINVHTSKHVHTHIYINTHTVIHMLTYSCTHARKHARTHALTLT